MRSEIAEERADMLDQLDGLDDTTRERIRPVVIDSAISIYNSYSFDLAVRRVFKVNPLPGLIRSAAVVFLVLLLPLTPPVQAVGHLRTGGAWFTVMGMFLAGIWVARAGPPGRPGPRGSDPDDHSRSSRGHLRSPVHGLRAA